MHTPVTHQEANIALTTVIPLLIPLDIFGRLWRRLTELAIGSMLDFRGGGGREEKLSGRGF